MIRPAIVALLASAALAQNSSPGVRVIPQSPSAPAAAAHKNPPAIANKLVARSGPLLTLLDEHVDYLMRENPTWASTRGDQRFDAQLRDESPAAYDRRLGEMKARLDRLKALDRAAFNDEDTLDADLLEYELTLAVDGAALHAEQMPVNAMDGPQVSWPQICDSIPLRTPKQLADYATRLEQIATVMDQTIAQMRSGLAAGRTPPREVLKYAVAAALAQASPEFEADPTLSPFYRPFRSPAVKNEAAAERARTATKSGIVPAYRNFAAFLKDEYIPHCRETIGYSQGVDGPAAYAHQLRFYTTLPLTPQQVHDVGLKEVARIRTEMLAQIDRTDFPQKDTLKGDALFAAFLAYLRSDPRFYFASEDEMLAGYRDICKRIDPELPRLFKTLPRNTYGVRGIPRFASSTSPAAYYYPGSIRSGVPGNFMVNIGKLDQRPTYGMVSLAIHEAVPGHHFQGSIADELDTVHSFRTITSYTAYIEGWALYAEKLGLEMDPGPGLRRTNTSDATGGTGFYADPYDNFGRLSDEIWRACRLVVDTGLHAQGWTRDRAIKYMMENTAATEVDCISEVDRYISWPGQACAYKIGEMTISHLRSKAQSSLGDSFDLRAFHDAILLSGALPMPVLENRINRWIEQQTPRK